jgi:hypothetical protein
MNPADAQLFVDLATGLERDLAPLSQAERAHAVSNMIRSANVAYAVWRDGEGYRLRRLRYVEPSGDEETLAGIPVSGAAHADLLEAAASHGKSRFCQ